MSGTFDGDKRDTIRLKPSISIRCGSTRCKENVRNAVVDLSYLNTYAVHFRHDAPRFACKSVNCSSKVARATATEDQQPTAESQGGLSIAQKAGIGVRVSFGILLVPILWFMFRLLKKRRAARLYLETEMSAPEIDSRAVYSEFDDGIIYPELAGDTPELRGNWRAGRGSHLHSGNTTNIDAISVVTLPLSTAPLFDVKNGSTQEPKTKPESDIDVEVQNEKYEEPSEGDSATRSNHSTLGMKVQYLSTGSNSMLRPTIGGLIRVNGLIYGLTTGHAPWETLFGNPLIRNSNSMKAVRYKLLRDVCK